MPIASTSTVLETVIQAGMPQAIHQQFLRAGLVYRTATGTTQAHAKAHPCMLSRIAVYASR